jgi:hypothetical protein
MLESVSGYYVEYEPTYLPVVVKENASPPDVAWIVAHQLAHPDSRIEETQLGRGAQMIERLKLPGD